MEEEAKLQAERDRLASVLHEIDRQLDVITKEKRKAEWEKKRLAAQAEADVIVHHKIVDVELYRDAQPGDLKIKSILLEGPGGELHRLEAHDAGHYTYIDIYKVSQCPVCGSAEIDPTRIAVPGLLGRFASVGARKCNECGHHWPLKEIPECGSQDRPHKWRMEPQGHRHVERCINCKVFKELDE